VPWRRVRWPRWRWRGGCIAGRAPRAANVYLFAAVGVAVFVGSLATLRAWLIAAAGPVAVVIAAALARRLRSAALGACGGLCEFERSRVMVWTALAPRRVRSVTRAAIALTGRMWPGRPSWSASAAAKVRPAARDRSAAAAERTRMSSRLRVCARAPSPRSLGQRRALRMLP
jgi:hypothetical protein